MGDMASLADAASAMLPRRLGDMASGGDLDAGAAMLVAAKQGDLKAVRQFLDEVELTTDEYTTALMCTKDTEVAALLLERGADVHLKGKSGMTALALTCDKDMAALLMSWGAEDNVLLAAQRDDLEAVRRFLDSGVSVDSQAWFKLQIELGPEDTMALLLGRGASNDIQAQAKVLGYKDLATDDSLGKLGKGPGWVLAVAAELDEEQLGKMVAGLTAPPKETHEAFKTLVHWMEEAEKRTRALRSADPRSADEQADLFVRLQLAAAAFLENLPGDSSEISETVETDKKVQKLLAKEECVDALNSALRVNAKELFAQPVMQRYVQHVWQGKDLQYELIKLSSSWKKVFSFGGLCRRIMLVLILLVNLLLLPVVALVPPLDEKLVAIDKAAREKAKEARKEARKASMMTMARSMQAKRKPPKEAACQHQHQGRCALPLGSSSMFVCMYCGVIDCKRCLSREAYCLCQGTCGQVYLLCALPCL